MTYLDLFSGYGGFHLALENAGFTFDEVYFSEIDPHAIANYLYNFPKAKYAGAIQFISRDIVPRADIISFGWPCQDNSIAGKRKGQSGGTRSSLLTEAVGVSKNINLDISLLKTSPACSLSIKVLTSSKQLGFSVYLMKVVHNMTLKCSFLIQSGFYPKIVSGYSLSDILEEQVADKYFLSEKTLAGLMKGQATPQVLEP